jgi:hypothetical protein
MADGQTYIAQSTEETSLVMESIRQDKQQLRVEMHHSPKVGNPLLNLSIDVWSYNQPVLLMRHTTTNISGSPIKDIRVYNIMDLDVGGPRSYKDDTASFDEKTGTMTIWDDNPLYVMMASRPHPDGWEITPPTHLKVTHDHLDLSKNMELGPRDIACALQWNLDGLKNGESRSIDLVFAAGTRLDEVQDLIPRAWDLFGKKLR